MLSGIRLGDRYVRFSGSLTAVLLDLATKSGTQEEEILKFPMQIVKLIAVEQRKYQMFRAFRPNISRLRRILVVYNNHLSLQRICHKNVAGRQPPAKSFCKRI